MNQVKWILGGKDGASATVQTFLTRAVVLAINIATGMITARFLGPDGRGEQAAMVMWPSLIANLMTFGLPSALVFNLKKYPQEKDSIFSAAIFTGIIISLISTIIGIVFIPYWMRQYTTDIIKASQAFMILTPVLFLSILFASTLEALGNFSDSNKFRYAPLLMTVSSLILLAWTGTISPLYASMAYSLPAIPITFFMVRSILKELNFTKKRLKVASSRLFKYGIRSYGIDLLGTLSAQIGTILVVGLLSATSLGFYSVCFNITRTLGTLQSSLVTVIFPKAAGRPTQEVVDMVGQAARISIAGLGTLSIILILLANTILSLLYGPEFLTATLLFRILLIESLLSCTTWLLTQAFMAAGRPGLATILQGIGLGVSVPCTIILVPAFGIEGAGLALLVSTATRFILALVCFPLVLKTKIPGLILGKKDIKFIQLQLKIV